MKQNRFAQQATAGHGTPGEGEERLRLFIECAPVAIAMLDTKMCYMAVSRRWVADYGLAGQDLYRRSHYEIFPEIPEHWKQVHRRCLAGAIERSDEEVFVRADGSRQWIRWEIHPWRGVSDVVGGIVIFTEDITLHKQAEEALGHARHKLVQQVAEWMAERAAERTAQLTEAIERFEWVVKATRDGLWDWDLIHDTLYFSPHWKEMHGFLETDNLESLQEWAERIHPEDRSRILGRFQAYLKNQQQFEFWEEYRIRKKNGSYMWVLDRGVAVWDGQGRAVRMVGAETDITLRKEAEEAERRKAHEFSMLANNVPALFCYVDRDRRYRFVNKRYEELFGLPTEEIERMSLYELLGPEGYAAVLSNLDAAFQGQAISFECSLPVPGMGVHWFAAQYVPDQDPQGNVAGLFILLSDITSLKITEAALREREVRLQSLSAKLLRAQEEERRRLARELHDDFTQRQAALAMDLRTVCVALSDSNPIGASRLQQLGDSAERLARDLQQMAHQLHPSILEHVGLEAAMREHVDEFAARTGLSIEIMVRELPKAVPLEQATCLYRVLQESLQNVRKHAEATTVLVRLLRTGRGLGLCVHDDGQGFEQAKSGRKGLGLTSIEERVKGLNGTVHIYSKPGDGTEVHAWVPLEDVECEV
ncbi:MAG: PAS domain S-box protein [Nitrospirota bacterium]